MKTITECLGENIKRLRVERGYTQEEFAKKAKLSGSFLQSIEQGKKWVGPKTINALARSLKVTESELFHDCARRPQPDHKEILFVIGRALGIQIEEKVFTAFKVRTPPFTYAALYESMPDEVFVELTRLCRDPKWDWERFRKRLRSS